MLDPRHPAPIWLIWPSLSTLERLVYLALCTLAAYSLFLAVVVVRLRQTDPIQADLGHIRKRVRNLQQATLATFYVFGFVLFAAFQFAYFTIEDGSMTVGSLVLRNFQVHFAFAANVFLVQLISHFIQWFVANRLGILGLGSNS